MMQRDGNVEGSLQRMIVRTEKSEYLEVVESGPQGCREIDYRLRIWSLLREEKEGKVGNMRDLQILATPQTLIYCIFYFHPLQSPFAQSGTFCPSSVTFAWHGVHQRTFLSSLCSAF